LTSSESVGNVPEEYLLPYSLRVAACMQVWFAFWMEDALLPFKRPFRVATTVGRETLMRSTDRKIKRLLGTVGKKLY